MRHLNMKNKNKGTQRIDSNFYQPRLTVSILTCLLKRTRHTTCNHGQHIIDKYSPQKYCPQN